MSLSGGSVFGKAAQSNIVVIIFKKIRMKSRARKNYPRFCNLDKFGKLRSEVKVQLMVFMFQLSK